MENSSNPQKDFFVMSEGLVNHLREIEGLDYFAELAQAGCPALHEEIQQILNIQKVRELTSPKPLSSSE